MLDQDVVRFAQERVRLEVDEQAANLDREITRIKQDMSAHGAFHSGGTLVRITDSCVLAIKNRAQLIWQTYFRFLTTTGISYSDELAEELKRLAEDSLQENLDDLKEIVKQNAKLIGNPDLFMHLSPQIDAARKASLAKIGTEIDLFIHSLKKKAEMKEQEKSSTILNIYSPVGAIQTGDSSIANISQTVDTDIKEQLQVALQEISTALIKSNFDMPYPREDVIEIVQDGQKELQKITPNMTRLRSILSTIGTSIQTVASLKPAYESLKQALTFLGVSLP